MRKAIVSDTARSELRLITEYLAVFSRNTAVSFVREFDDKIKTLEEGVVEYPIARQPELSAMGFRIALVKSYLMLYTVDDGGDVYVAHVFHQSQDYAALVVAAR